MKSEVGKVCFGLEGRGNRKCLYGRLVVGGSEALGCSDSRWPADVAHLLAEVRVKHPLWWNCMSLTRRMDWIWGWKALNSL